MLPPGFHKYSASAENLTLLADAGDFFAMIGGAVPWVLLGIRVFQRGTTTLIMNSLRFHRGVGAVAGGALTEFKYGTAAPAATVIATSLPTTDVGTDDWEWRDGWNLLQAAVKMPMPELWIPFKANDDLGITRIPSTAHTGVGVQVEWAEFVGS